MIKGDDIYEEMMCYYDQMSMDTDRYWNRSLYEYTNENNVLFSEREKLDDLAKNISGRVLDLGCGSGHWMELYYNECYKITLVDQSSKMLQVCKRKISKLKDNRANIYIFKSDMLELTINDISGYDYVVLGYIMGHLTPSMQDCVFKKIDKWLNNNGKVFLVDSLLHDDLVKEEKSGVIQKRSVDGKEYNIYKKYFEKSELDMICSKNDYQIISEMSFYGKYFAGLIMKKYR